MCSFLMKEVLKHKCVPAICIHTHTHIEITRQIELSALQICSLNVLAMYSEGLALDADNTDITRQVSSCLESGGRARLEQALRQS